MLGIVIAEYSLLLQINNLLIQRVNDYFGGVQRDNNQAVNTY